MAAELVSPYNDNPNAFWMRGNLHTHSTRSDGRSDPQEVIRHYAGLGHDFLAISDHDTAGSYNGLDANGLVLIPTNEVSAGGPHMLDVGCTTLIGHDDDLQATVSAIARDSGFVVLCHPNWRQEFNHYTYEQMADLTDYVGIEIFNGTCIEHPGSHLAIDKWDRLLGDGKEVWGFANDDAHRIENGGRGWNVVRVAERTAEAVLQALRTGSFYASSGVEITELSVNGAVLTLTAPNARRIAVFADYGRRIHVVDGPALTFDAADLPYHTIRIECCGDSDAQAWTQPMLIRGGKLDQIKANFRAITTPTLAAQLTDRSPLMTGQIDDPLWESAESTSRLLRNADGEPPSTTTELRALAHDRTVYIAARCEEPNPEAMKLAATRDGDKSLWADDAVEVFIGPADGSDYAHIMVNANGVVTVVMCGSPDTTRPTVKAVAGRDDRGWTLELAIALGAPLTRGAEFKFHISRNRPTAKEVAIWSAVEDDNHNVGQYGRLVIV